MTEKLPLGLMPRSAWIKERVHELLGAIQRYIETYPPTNVPQTWLDELRDLTCGERATPPPLYSDVVNLSDVHQLLHDFAGTTCHEGLGCSARDHARVFIQRLRND